MSFLGQVKEAYKDKLEQDVFDAYVARVNADQVKFAGDKQYAAYEQAVSTHTAAIIRLEQFESRLFC